MMGTGKGGGKGKTNKYLALNLITATNNFYLSIYKNVLYTA